MTQWTPKDEVQMWLMRRLVTLQKTWVFSFLQTEIWGTCVGMDSKGVGKCWREDNFWIRPSWLTWPRSRDSAFNVVAQRVRKSSNSLVGWLKHGSGCCTVNGLEMPHLFGFRDLGKLECYSAFVTFKTYWTHWRVRKTNTLLLFLRNKFERGAPASLNSTSNFSLGQRTTPLNWET